MLGPWSQGQLPKKAPEKSGAFYVHFLFLSGTQLEGRCNSDSCAGFYSDIFSLRPCIVIDQELHLKVRLCGGRGPLPSIGVDVFHDRSIIPAESRSIASE